MRIESVTAHAFGPLSNTTLHLGSGMTVVTGANESAKSSWHAAVCVAVVGRRRGKGASTLQERRFAELHKPWDAPGWRVSAILCLDDGRRIEMSQELEGKVDCRATDLALGRDVSADLIFEGSPDGSRLLGLDRRSFAATAVVNQTELLSVISEADGLQEHLQRAAATAGADATAAAALDVIQKYLSEHVGLDRANSTKPLRTAITAAVRAQTRRDAALTAHVDHLALVQLARDLDLKAQDSRSKSNAAESLVLALGRVAEGVNAIAIAQASVDRGTQQLEFAKEAERILAERVSKVGALATALRGQQRMTAPDSDGLSTSVSAALAAFRSVPASRHLTGRSSAEIQAEIEALPEQPEGDRKPDLVVQASWEALKRARSIHDAHQAEEPRPSPHEGQPEVQSAVVAGPAVLREMAAQLRAAPDSTDSAAPGPTAELSLARERLTAAEVLLEASMASIERSGGASAPHENLTHGGPAKPSTWGLLVIAVGAAAIGSYFAATGQQLAFVLGAYLVAVASGIAASILMMRRRGIAGLVQVGQSSAVSPSSGLQEAREDVNAAGRQVAQLEGRLAAQESIQRSAAAARSQLLAQANTRDLPIDPDTLLRLAEMAEQVAESRAQLRRWASTRDDYVSGLRQADTDLRLALVDRGELSDLEQPAHEQYRRYEQRCSQRLALGEQAALRPRLEAELDSRLEGEQALAAEDALRQSVEVGVREAVARTGAEIAAAAPILDYVNTLEVWQTRHEAKLADIQLDQQRWAELDALLDGATGEELEARLVAARQQTSTYVEQAADADQKASLMRDDLEQQVQSARLLGVALPSPPTCSAVETALATYRDVAQIAVKGSQELAGAVERADGTAAERARTLDSVAESEEALAAAEAELARVRELEKTLQLTHGFLTDAQTRVHQDIAPVLAETLRMWLPSVTSGRYVDAIVDPATLKVRVCGPDRRWRDADRLSVGTAEQIYLLLRMALAERLTSTSESCPLLLDDVTVQADQERTIEILNLLLALSSDRQVVIFAQEPSVDEWAREHLVGDPRHRLIQLEPVTCV